MRDVDQEPEGLGRPPSRPLTNTRLNPLLNPLLANQLGRWAQIYYTAPLAKREAAVEELVRELEAESARLEEPKLAGAGPEEFRLGEPKLERPKLELPKLERPGSSESASLSAHADVPEPKTQTYSEPIEDEEFAVPAEFHAPRNESEVVAEPYYPADTARQEGTDAEFFIAKPSILEPDGAFDPQTEQAAELDHPAFREQSVVPAAALTHLRMVLPRHLRSRRLLVAASLVLAMGAVVWMTTRRPHASTSARVTVPAIHPQPPSLALPQAHPVTHPSAPTTQPQMPVTTTASQDQEAVQDTSKENTQKKEDTPQAVAPGESGNQNRAPSDQPILAAKIIPAENNTTESSSDADLAAGLRYLRGAGVERNSEQAAQHLWKAVGRQNGSALLILAGLYAKGDGVAKDCDQARVLILAASRQATTHRKIKSVAEARENLQASGCE